LFAQLRRLKGSGIGILYISHRLEEIVEIADRATILRDGRVVGSLARAELSVERVANLMLGASRVQVADHGERAEPGDVLLEVRGFTREPAFRDVDLEVRAGEIVGLTGLVGAGRTELARCIFGADARDRGELLVRGTPATISSPRDAIGAGVGYLSEDRKSQGVFFWLDVRQNLMTSALRRLELRGRLLRFGQLIRGGTVERIARDMISRLDIRPAEPAAQVGTMSGGNQQKVIMGRWLTTEVPILIFDEPTRGVDVGAKADIWARLRELTHQGTAILAISSEVPELLAHADRIVVMKAGRIAGELAPTTATEESVMLLAGGTN
jgi:ribose transport system ATP-binding protein